MIITNWTEDYNYILYIELYTALSFLETGKVTISTMTDFETFRYPYDGFLFPYFNVF